MLTTTSYAILGQLAWGEATTYELVKAMGRNLRFMWPRAESRIYEEAKRLVVAGLGAGRPAPPARPPPPAPPRPPAAGPGRALHSGAGSRRGARGFDFPAGGP